MLVKMCTDSWSLASPARGSLAQCLGIPLPNEVWKSLLWMTWGRTGDRDYICLQAGLQRRREVPLIAREAPRLFGEGTSSHLKMETPMHVT